MNSRLFVPLSALAALALFAVVPPAFADTPPDLVANGRILLDQNDKEGALKTLQAAVAANPKDFTAQLLLTRAYLRWDEPNNAVASADAALALAPTAPSDKAQASFYAGKAHMEACLAKIESLNKHLNDATTSDDLAAQMSTHIHEDNNNTTVQESGSDTAADDFHDSRASHQDNFENINEQMAIAEKDFRAALAADPQFPEAHDGLGMALVLQRRNPDAQAQFQAEIKRDPASPVALMHLGDLDAQTGDRKGAIAAYQSAIHSDPRLVDAYDGLAPLYEREKMPADEQWAKGMSLLYQGEFGRAEAAFANVKEPTAAIYRGQATLALAQKKPEAARPILEQAVAKFPDDAASRVMLGELQFESGQTDAASDNFTKATVSDPTNDGAWYGVGLVDDKAKKSDDAIAAYQKAVDANPGNQLARLNLAADEADAGQKANALTNLHEYLRRFPTAKNASDIETFARQLEGS